LPVEEFTLAEALQEAGYQTIHIGKWHLGSEPFCLPQHHGFDINIAGNAHGAPGQYFFPYQGDWSIPTTPHRAKWNVFPDGKPGEYLTDRLTDEAVKLIEDAREQPFFLYFPHYGVHTPLQAPEELAKKYERVPKAKRQGKPVYAAMVETIDNSVGRVLDALRVAGKEDNTVIIFTSDNGGFYKATSNAPLRANKGAYYEGGIRVPLIVKWPGVSRAGRVIHEPVISNDLYPTCLSAAGLALRPNQHSDGVNLRSLLADTESLPPRSLFWHFPHYNKHPSSVPSSVIRKGDWKLIESLDPAGMELYNLKTDLGEMVDLAEKQPDRRDGLLKELEAWRVSVRAERMLPNPDFDANAKSRSR
jgi:arylsulfatase A